VRKEQRPDSISSGATDDPAPTKEASISRTFEYPESARTRAHIIRARTWVVVPAELSTERHLAHDAGPASGLQNDTLCVNPLCGGLFCHGGFASVQGAV
jgi:hypothetical protein